MSPYKGTDVAGKVFQPDGAPRQIRAPLTFAAASFFAKVNRLRLNLLPRRRDTNHPREAQLK